MAIHSVSARYQARLSSLCHILVVLFLAVPCSPAQADDCVDPFAKQRTQKEARALLEVILQGGAKPREAAARQLAVSGGRHVLSEVRRALGEAGPRGVRVDLAYVLASYGDRRGFIRLIEFLTEARDDVWHQLRRAAAANADAGQQDVCPSRWWRWLATQSDEDLKSIRAVPAWLRTSDPVWDDYLRALQLLREDGLRRESARILRRIAVQHPESEHAASARELSVVLEEMADEDDVWAESLRGPHPRQIPEIDGLIYRLRDVTADSCLAHARASVLRTRDGPGDCTSSGSSAVALLEMGESAIPYLVDLLEDRRATRVVAAWRFSHASRTVLRYQDAAIEILGEILQWQAYRPRGIGIYFSMETEDRRRAISERVRSWCAATAGKSPIERDWITARMAPLPDALRALRRLAMDADHRAAVLRELELLFDARTAWRPEICEAMCDLGDFSRLRQVMEMLTDDAPEYAELMHPDPDDGARFLNARLTMLRIQARYGGKLRGSRR